MRLNVHDYSGHPFQVQLSRELAARGHVVLHTYAEQYISGRGQLTVTDADPATLRIQALRVDRPLQKYSPVQRIAFERDYARAWQELLDVEPVDLVVACNVPLFALARMRRYFESRNQRWVLWHQDLYSLGVGGEASRRLPGPLAALARRRVERMEQAQVRSADAVIPITDAMVRQYYEWGVDASHATVLPNWAPIKDITPVPRDNRWSREQQLPQEAVRLMYAGTLGRKHNPMLLLDILDGMQRRGVDALLIVASEGEGADLLAAAAQGRRDVRVVGYQPAERFSDVLSSADCVIALLEPDASRFSVPSKVLSYLSAGRPIIALMPSDNPAADDVRAAGGFVGEPVAADAARAARWLVAQDGRALQRLGQQARELAEARFDIQQIADRFEMVFASTMRPAIPVSSSVEAMPVDLQAEV